MYYYFRLVLCVCVMIEITALQWWCWTVCHWHCHAQTATLANNDACHATKTDRKIVWHGFNDQKITNWSLAEWSLHGKSVWAVHNFKACSCRASRRPGIPASRHPWWQSKSDFHYQHIIWVPAGLFALTSCSCCCCPLPFKLRLFLEPICKLFCFESCFF